jgi:hypothetical protein
MSTMAPRFYHGKASEDMTSANGDASCRHCGQGSPRRRGLCGKCYANKKIRAGYGPISPHGKQYVESARTGNYLTPARKAAVLAALLPTDALPGSQEKIEILARRFELGLPLFQPGDSHMNDLRDGPARHPLPEGLEAFYLGVREPPRRRVCMGA